MTFPLVVGTLLVGAVVVAALRQRLSARKDSGPLQLGAKDAALGRRPGQR